MELPPIDAVAPGEKENDGDEYFHEVAFLGGGSRITRRQDFAFLAVSDNRQGRK